MMSCNQLKLIIIAGLIIILGRGVVRSYPDYLKVYANDPQSRPELRTKCAVCHTSPQGGGTRNSFGNAFERAGLKITPELRGQFPDLFSGGTAQLPAVEFVEGSSSEAIVEIDGRRYLIDTRAKSVRALAQVKDTKPDVPSSPVIATTSRTENDNFYITKEQRLVNLPTAAPIAGGSLWIDFNHRFPFGRPTNAAGLFGLDAMALPSFGGLYGLTDRLHVGIYRSPGDLGRPIQLLAGFRFLGEEKGDPFSATARVAFEGRDNIQRQFATSFVLTVARSIGRQAQLYLVPTFTLGDRPFNTDLTAQVEGRRAFALGIGGALRIVPSVNLLAEANYRLNATSRYPEVGGGIWRPVVGFGIQKESQSRRHAFTLTLSNGPGTTTSQRSQTRGIYGADDGLRGLTIGFNLSRRFFK